MILMSASHTPAKTEELALTSLVATFVLALRGLWVSANWHLSKEISAVGSVYFIFPVLGWCLNKGGSFGFN